jgi:hypothetical protein
LQFAVFRVKTAIFFVGMFFASLTLMKLLFILNLSESRVLPLCGASGYPAWLSFILEG